MKDTSNLLGYNAWSGGDYTEDLTDLTSNTVTSITNKNSNIGENSIQIGRDTSRWWTNSTFTGTNGASYTFTVDVYNPKGDATLRLVSNGTTIASVSIPKNNSWATYSVTGTVGSTNCSIQILNQGTTGTFVYFDNLKVNITA